MRLKSKDLRILNTQLAKCSVYCGTEMELEVKLHEMKLDPVCEVLMTLYMYAWPQREQAAAAGIVWKMFIAGVMKNTMYFDYLVESRLFFPHHCHYFSHFLLERFGAAKVNRRQV